MKKGYEIVLVNYKEQVFIPLRDLRKVLHDRGDAYLILNKPIQPIPNSNELVEVESLKMRITEILASDDFEEVCVPSHTLHDARDLYIYFNKEQKRIKDRLGVNLMSFMNNQ